MATVTRWEQAETAPASGRPALHRERHPILAALGVLLILTGALAGLLIQQRAGDRITAVQLAQRVPAGGQISSDDIRPVQVAPTGEIDYVRWDQRDQLDDYYTLVELAPGSVLTGGMLTTKAPPVDGQIIIGIALQSGQYPSELMVGDLVHAIYIGDGVRSRAPTLASAARVYSISTAGDASVAGEASVSLVVSLESAPPVAAAAATGEVALALIPNSQES